jgi:protein TonB
MVHAHAALPRLPLDAKRIAATSAVIALHAGVLMMLMMPVQLTRTVDLEEEDRPYVPDFVRMPPPPPPPPPAQQVRAQVTPQPVHVPVASVDPPVESADQSVGAMDFQVQESPLAPDSYQVEPAGTGFLQLATLVAPAPSYPRAAITRRLAGTVTLRIHVDAGGLPTEVLVEQSSGHALLDDTAVKTVLKRWRFVPATRDGQPVEGWAMVPISFVLP